MPSSPTGIWSRVDETIEEWRYIIAAGLLGIALIGVGVYALSNNTTNLAPPVVNTESPSRVSTTDAPTVSALVNVNTATPAELDTLPGIGPVIAQRIIDYRTVHGSFKKKEDLEQVKGIGPKTYADLQDKITIE